MDSMAGLNQNADVAGAVVVSRLKAEVAQIQNGAAPFSN